MANKPSEANFFPDVPEFPSMGAFQPVYGKFDLTTYIQGASDYEIMAFLVGKYNACLGAYGTVTKLSTDTVTACKQLQDWINKWFDNLDVQQEINRKLDEYLANGTLLGLVKAASDALAREQIPASVTKWLNTNVTPTGSAVMVDKSLSITGAAADAKATGANIDSAQANLLNKLNFSTEENLLNEKNVYKNNYYLNERGEFRIDNRGFRVYWLAVEIGKPITISIDNLFFYAIQSDTLTVENNKLVDVDTSTWVDTANKPYEKTLTITPTHRYIWFDFFDVIFNTLKGTTQIMVNEGTTAKKYEPYHASIDIENKGSLSAQQFAYIKSGKLCTNITTPTRTAQYAGINCGYTPNYISAAFVFEEGTTGGTAAIICNPSGLTKVNDIVNASLHCVITPTKLKVDLLGQKYGKYYYYNFIEETFETSIPLDGVTETAIKMQWSPKNVTVTLTKNGESKTYISEDYSGAIPFANFVGHYVTIEHYCEGDRNAFAMPQFSRFETGNSNQDNSTRIFDNFKRQDGSLSVTPTGQVWTCISNAYNNND